MLVSYPVSGLFFLFFAKTNKQLFIQWLLSIMEPEVFHNKSAFDDIWDNPKSSLCIFTRLDRFGVSYSVSKFLIL